MAGQTVVIYRVGGEPPVAFAARELARCLRKMAPVQCQVKAAKAYDAKKPGIYVGTGEALRSAVGARLCKASEDDELLVRSVGSSVLVSGSNPRSVLFAAYRLLQSAGARWPIPGKAGEYLPTLKRLALGSLNIHERPAYRHRGVCNEGSISLEHCLDFVDWMPKACFNAFMLQFKNSGEFYRRWYDRRYNPDWLKPRELSEEDCFEIDDKVIAAMKQRGLLVHRVGHGWTTESLGLIARGWGQSKLQPKEEDRALLALVKGKRELFQNIAANTELCYSNPEARRRLVKHVVEYAQQHPEVDYLHFWMSDGTNNHCECAECVKTEPSDFYVRLVKEISGRLKQVAPNTKLVFLCYANTLWPAVEEKLGREYDNVVFMWAPISRCFAHKLTDPRCAEDAPMKRPVRNKLEYPRRNRENLALRKMWGERVDADSFVYDYYLGGSSMVRDGGLPLAKVLYQDIRDWKSLDINGIVSCQTQRSFYPTGFAQWVMGEASWNPRRRFEDLGADYFGGAFGPAAGTVRAYLEGLAKAAGAPAHTRRWVGQASAGQAQQMVKYLRGQAPRLQAAAKRLKARAQRQAMAIVRHHNRMSTMVWSALLAQQSGKRDKAMAELDKALAFLRRTEKSLHLYGDFSGLIHFVQALRHNVTAG